MNYPSIVYQQNARIENLGVIYIFFASVIMSVFFYFLYSIVSTYNLHHKLSFSDYICAHACIIHGTHLDSAGEILFGTLA